MVKPTDEVSRAASAVSDQTLARVTDVRKTVVSIWISGLSVLAATIALSWNGNPYWMDSKTYARCVAEGGWVVHPPGYLFFLALGRLLYSLGFVDSYRALQVLTLLLTVGGALMLFRLLREVIDPVESSLLTFAFALSWIPLLINHTGTSPTADLFTSPLLLWSALRLTDRPSRMAAALFAGAIAICGGFRLATLVMMCPLLVGVLWANRRNGSWAWGALVVGGLLVGLVQLITIHLMGGWDRYAYLLTKLQGINHVSSPIVVGFTQVSLLNLFRSLAWFALATLGMWLALCSLRLKKPWNFRHRMILNYGILAAAGPLIACSLYLCEHPGYLAPALPGFYLCVAVAWCRSDSGLKFARWPIVAILASLSLFFGLHYYRTPATTWQAIANGNLLQYSADGARNACYATTTAWLRATEL